MNLRVLDVGAGAESVARVFWPEAEIQTLDADSALKPDLLGDILSIPSEDCQYDKVLASHVLEHIPYHDGLGACREMARVTKDGGEVHILVPSLEWAARQVLSENRSPITIPHLYGLQTNEWQYHKAGYTMLNLRQVMQAAGLRVIAAQRSIYHVSTVNGDGEPHLYPAEQHYVIGVKHARHADHAQV